MRNLLILAVILSAGLAVPAEGAEQRVVMKGMAFSPAQFSVKAGDTVIWVNDDFVNHTATATAKQFDVVIPAHSQKNMIATEAGTFDYFCRFHPMMKGRMQVDPKP
ncbi:MAG: cupredoxin domain-containing protein [Parvibaculaceae bacterium]